MSAQKPLLSSTTQPKAPVTTEPVNRIHVYSEQRFIMDVNSARDMQDVIEYCRLRVTQ